MIVDAFMFFNELDTLEIRLRELHPVVDLFILLECGEALSGVKKPYIFEENRQRFSPFLNKIRHIKLPGLPPLIRDTEDRRFWLEAFQRNHLLSAMVGTGMEKDDVVLISDVDEIPTRSSVLKAAGEIRDGETWIFKQRYYKSFFDIEPPDEAFGRAWLGTVAVRYSMFGEIMPDDLRRRRAHAGRFSEPNHSHAPGHFFIEDGGWHLTYFGGERAHRYKTANFAHGANGLQGDARSVPVATISKDALFGLREFDEDMRAKLSEFIETRLSGDVPGPVYESLQEYFHLFRMSFSQKPLPWLKD